jgi:hypothetical protein
LETIRADIDRGPEAALRTIGAGMLRLSPLGLLLPLVARRLGGGRFTSLVHTIAAGAMVALVIEWSQSLVPSRVADVDSIILNTAGIAVTHQLCYGRLRTLTLHKGGNGGRRTIHRQDSRPATPARRPAQQPSQQPTQRPSHGRAHHPAHHSAETATGTAPDPAEPPAHEPPAHESPAHETPAHKSAHNRAAPRGVRGAALSR